MKTKIPAIIFIMGIFLSVGINSAYSEVLYGSTQGKYEIVTMRPGDTAKFFPITYRGVSTEIEIFFSGTYYSDINFTYQIKGFAVHEKRVHKDDFNTPIDLYGLQLTFEGQEGNWPDRLNRETCKIKIMVPKHAEIK